MENKCLVVYKSRTGFTQKYAQMIAEEMNCTIVDNKSVKTGIMSEYDTVIFGSRVHAGRIDEYKKAKEMFQQSNAKRFILFATGATPIASEKAVEDIWNQNLSADELINTPHFYIQSGLCYEKMPFLDKLIMKMVASILKKSKNKSDQDKGFEQAISGSYDISSKDYIKPLISYLKEINKEGNEVAL